MRRSNLVAACCRSARPLRGHDVAGGRDLRLERGDLDRVQLVDRLLAGGDVDVELLEVVEVELVHLVEHGHVLEQRHARALQGVDELLDARRDLLVAGGEAFEGVGEAAEDRDLRLAGAGAQRVDVQLADLLEQVGERLAAGPGVLVAHVAEQRVGEVGDAALGREAVGDHGLRVAHVDGGLDLRDPLEVDRRQRSGGGLVAGGRRRRRHELRRRVLLLDLVAHDASSSGVHERAAVGSPLIAAPRSGCTWSRCARCARAARSRCRGPWRGLRARSPAGGRRPAGRP